MKEGIYLLEAGQSPYAGDAYHQAPLLLALFSLFPSSSSLSPQYYYTTPLLFVATDFAIAILLMLLSQRYLAHPTFIISSSASSSSSSSSTSISPSPSSSVTATTSTSPPLTGEIVFCVYLLNPWTILTCVAQSTIVFNNLAVILCLYAAIKGTHLCQACSLFATGRAAYIEPPGNLMLATLCLACATYLSLYPAILILPVAAILYTQAKKRNPQAVSMPSSFFLRAPLTALHFHRSRGGLRSAPCSATCSGSADCSIYLSCS